MNVVLDRLLIRLKVVIVNVGDPKACIRGLIVMRTALQELLVPFRGACKIAFIPGSLSPIEEFTFSRTRDKQRRGKNYQQQSPAARSGFAE